MRGVVIDGGMVITERCLRSAKWREKKSTGSRRSNLPRRVKMRRIWSVTMAACLLGGLVGVGQNIFAGQEAGGARPTAQRARPHSNQVERELQRMSRTLKLTDDQVAKIRPILQTRNKQLKDLRANSSLPQGYARTKAREIRKYASQQIDLVLTPEQKERRKAMRQGIGARRSGQAGQPPQSK
jgi:Spy/CpxP family protein refolding chaperone